MSEFQKKYDWFYFSMNSLVHWYSTYYLSERDTERERRAQGARERESTSAQVHSLNACKGKAET